MNYHKLVTKQVRMLESLISKLSISLELSDIDCTLIDFKLLLKKIINQNKESFESCKDQFKFQINVLKPFFNSEKKFSVNFC